MNAHILIIDDEQVWLKSLELMLIRKKYRVTSVNCGRKAVELLTQSSHVFTAILLDLMMPRMDGLEVLVALQPLLQRTKIPVIMQTGTQEDRHISEAFRLGALCCIRKPYGPSELYPLLEAILSGGELPTQTIFS